MNTRLFFLVCLTSSILFFNVEAKAKVDIGPAYVHLDILESGKTIDTMDIPCLRVDAGYIFDNGIAIKPTLLYGSNNGTLFTTGVAIGQYIPINEQWSFLPMIGVSYSYLRTRVDFPLFALTELRERFRSISPFVGLEAYYAFSSTFRLCGSFQYAWSRTHTDIQSVVNSKSHCQGPSYALLLEKDINESWSVNMGVAYNISLSKEKHGLRVSGAKIGLSRWF